MVHTVSRATSPNHAPQLSYNAQPVWRAPMYCRPPPGAAAPPHRAARARPTAPVRVMPHTIQHAYAPPPTMPSSTSQICPVCSCSTSVLAGCLLCQAPAAGLCQPPQGAGAGSSTQGPDTFTAAMRLVSPGAHTSSICRLGAYSTRTTRWCSQGCPGGGAAQPH